jgi:hypothetical protein
MIKPVYALIPLLLLTAPYAHAQFEYSTNDGTITITKYTGLGGAVSIPTTINGLTVTSIGDYAFFYSTGLTSVTIPNSVTNIGNYAFYGCTSLTNLSIPSAVTSIGDEAFEDCTSLTAITVDALNSSYSSVDGVLFNKSQYTLIQFPGRKAGGYTVPSSVTSIRAGAFYSCTNLTNVTIPNTVTAIGDLAFAECYSLTAVTIVNGVTSIGTSAFEDCTSLITMTIPNSVTSIGAQAFADCTSLTAITVEALNSSYSSVDGVLFDKSLTTLIQYPGRKAGNYTVPNSVGNIGNYAFYNCTNLTSVTLGTSVTNIGNDAFADCASLTSVTIPSSVTSIGAGAFVDCASLTSATIPSSVTNIGNDAFFFCTSLTAITVDALNSTYSSVDGVVFDKSQNTLTLCPEGRAGNYTVPNSVTNIGNNAFYGCASLTSVTIPSSVTSIGASAFADCTSLTSVTIPNSVSSIGFHAFEQCINLTAITVDALNSSYSSLDGVLFDKSQNTLIRYPEGKAGTYTVPSSVTTLGRSAFDLEDAAFSGCTSLTGVYFQGNAPSFNRSTFNGANDAIVYYLPGTLGWDTTLARRPTAVWKPQVQTRDGSFGTSTNGFGFNINWASGTTVVVEASTNVANPIWTPVSTNTLTTGSSYFADPQWTNHPGRFYRLRMP